MNDKLVRVEAVEVKGIDLFADLNRVRTAVRKALYGRTEPVGAVVEVVNTKTGDVEEWTFDRHVGYPEGSSRTNWFQDWQDQYN